MSDYQAMLSAQGGVCAICRKPPREGTRLQVDHDHGTGKVRELLCGNCNTCIAHARDERERLLAAAEYLAKHA